MSSPSGMERTFYMQTFNLKPHHATTKKNKHHIFILNSKTRYFRTNSFHFFHIYC